MKSYLIALALSLPLFGATAPKPAAKKADIVASIDAPTLTRAIAYDERDVPTVHARLHYTTVFVLPKAEKIMDLLCGHQEEWTINGADGTNFAYVKPERAGARTNLNLVTASGNVYSFLLVEGDAPQPDLKVFVEAKDSTMLSQMLARPKWVLASELDRASERVAAANGEAAAAKADAARTAQDAGARAEREIATFRGAFPASLRHDYVFKDRKQFGVRAMAHSKEFTYIWADPQETPALYEVKDSKPALINFDYANGVYIVPKVLDAGYLAVGKHKLEFRREE